MQIIVIWSVEEGENNTVLDEREGGDQISWIDHFLPGVSGMCLSSADFVHLEAGKDIKD